MKLKLSISQERYHAVKAALLEHGIEIDDNADLVLREADRFLDTLMVKSPADSQRICLPVDEIISAESFGHTIEVYAKSGRYQARERLYQLERQLDPQRFLRVSNSVIVARSQIQRITPTLSMKFLLTMADGRTVTVTRSYYYIFKEYFGI